MIESHKLLLNIGTVLFVDNVEYVRIILNNMFSFKHDLLKFLLPAHGSNIASFFWFEAQKY